MFKKSKKAETSWDILDKIWDEFHSMAISEDSSVFKNLTWKDLLDKISSKDTEKFVKNAALEKFVWESRFLYKKPNRETMKHLWGSHVELYDVFGCENHKFTLNTSDDVYVHIDGQTAFCPFCNRDRMTDEQFKKYFESNDVKVHTEEEWKMVMKSAKFHRDWNRKMNREYVMKNLFNFHYWKMKIARILK